MAKKLQKKKPPGIVYHYTTGKCLQGIVEAGQINPSSPGVHVPCEAVWFTRRCIWEPSANKLVGSNFTGKFERYFLSMEETEKAYGGLYRISVAGNFALLSWLDFKHKSGMSNKSATAFEKESIALGSSPMDYYSSFVAVPREKWLQVETWTGSAWEEWDQTARFADLKESVKSADLKMVIRQHIESGGKPI